MKTEKTSQQVFGQKYLLKTMDLNPGDTIFFSEILTLAGEKRIVGHPNSHIADLVFTTGDDTAEFFNKKNDSTFLNEYPSKAVRITEKTFKKLRHLMPIAKGDGILGNRQIPKAINAIKEVLGLKSDEEIKQVANSSSDLPDHLFA